MRTWSVNGTAFALCTRSSSLSIKTSTSMDFRSLQRVQDDSALSPEAPAAPGLGLRLRLGLRWLRSLDHDRRVGAGDPAAPTRPQLLEQLLRLAGGKLDLVALRETR